MMCSTVRIRRNPIDPIGPLTFPCSCAMESVVDCPVEALVAHFGMFHFYSDSLGFGTSDMLAVYGSFLSRLVMRTLFPVFGSRFHIRKSDHPAWTVDSGGSLACSTDSKIYLGLARSLSLVNQRFPNR